MSRMKNYIKLPIPFNGERTAFLVKGIQTTYKRINFYPCRNFYHVQKVNSKWIRELDVRAKTTKFLKESSRANLCDFGFGSLLRYDTKIPSAKKRKIHQTSSKFKTYTSKDDIKKVKRELKNGENIYKPDI